MTDKLNDLKKCIYLKVIEINEEPDVNNNMSDMVYFYGIRVTYYKITGIYSVKDLYEDIFKEISNRYVLKLMIQNLNSLCKKKKKCPDLKLSRIRK